MTPALRHACALVLAAASCAAPNAELNVAPLFARHTLPGWETAEALGGAVRHEADAAAKRWALSPLWWTERRPDGSAEADFLFALGRYRSEPERELSSWRLFPLGWWRSERRSDGIRDSDWSVLLWLIAGGSSEDGENYFWFFPFGGVGRDVLTYDEFQFALWPLWIRSTKDERRATHVLWPLFGWQDGSEDGWRFFPFYGRAEVPGKYRRSFWLWPFLNFAEDGLDLEHPRKGWLAFLIGGHVTQGDFEARSVLWPFFTWESQPSRGHRSFTIWPLLRFETNEAEGRTVQRVLPFWIRFRDPGTEFRSVLWPIFWWRRDRLDDDGERTAWYGLPLFFASRSQWSDGSTSEQTRFWPLFSERTERDGARTVRILDPGIPPVLDPEVLSRNFGFLYEVWSDRQLPAPAPIARDRRGWLGLWRDAEGSGHRRRSFAGLGGRWNEPDGTAHTALLFGLLRWRTGPDGARSFEAPAFPGPGWPDLSSLPPHPKH
jgi:hypothetical protein